MEDPHRLPRDVIPRQYRLVLQPDLDRFTFSGTALIEVEVAERTDRLVLNAVELDIDSVVVTGSASAPVDPHIELDAATERLTLSLPSPLAKGPATIEIAFRGTLNDQLRGFYRSTFNDESGTTRTIATTQFQATDARRAFPCWDEPDFKAIFAVTLVVSDDHLAVSNTAEVGREAIDGRLTAVHFADTVPMSTYLVAFVVGPLEAGPAVDAGGVPVRIVHVPGKGHLTPYALEVAVAALGFFRDYYALPYPGDKVDLIAIPDFAFGAMENLGCVTFREVLLLVDPDQASQAELQRVTDVVNHELAHMWFGDLVTMRWWNGIWLNEAFATFMEMKATDHFRPQWDRWTDFGLSRSIAFDVDTLAATRPIEYPVASPADAEGMFDVLTYEKGAAVVRMLEQHVGEDTFREGVRRYLDAHQFSNTETDDLWHAIGSVTDEPVAEIMRGWIFQGGYPMVGYRRDGTDLELHQQRAGFDSGADGHWLVPIGMSVGDHTTRLLLDQSARVAGADLPRLNVDGSGFYRVALDQVAIDAVAAGGAAPLPAVERYGIIDDAWSAVLAGALTIDTYLRLCAGFADDDELAVWQRIAGSLATLDHVADNGGRATLRRRAHALLAPAAARWGGSGADGETDRQRQLRATLLSALGITADDAETQAWARAIDRSGSNDPELATAAVAILAATGDHADFATFWERYRNADSPQVERRYLDALADFPDQAAIDELCQHSISDAIRSQDGPYVLGRALTNREFGPDVWTFVTDNWAEINDRFPSNSMARMLGGIRALSQPGPAEAVPRFLADHPVPQGEQMIAQHLERLLINVKLRARAAAELTDAAAE